MTNVLSPYQLIDIQLVESSMVVDVELLEIPTDTERPLDIRCSYKSLELNEGRNVGEQTMCVDYTVYHRRLKGSRKKPRPVVTLRVVLRGLVTAKFEEHMKEEERNHLLKVNAISLLYAEARSHLLAITALSPVGKVLLPPIDPYALVDEESYSNRQQATTRRV